MIAKQSLRVKMTLFVTLFTYLNLLIKPCFYKPIKLLGNTTKNKNFAKYLLLSQIRVLLMIIRPFLRKKSFKKKKKTKKWPRSKIIVLAYKAMGRLTSNFSIPWKSPSISRIRNLVWSPMCVDFLSNWFVFFILYFNLPVDWHTINKINKFLHQSKVGIHTWAIYLREDITTYFRYLLESNQKYRVSTDIYLHWVNPTNGDASNMMIGIWSCVCNKPTTSQISSGQEHMYKTSLSLRDQIEIDYYC